MRNDQTTGTKRCDLKSALGHDFVAGTFSTDCRCPLWVDIVAKVEIRVTRKISPKLIFGPLCGCVAIQRHYQGQ